MSGHTHSQWHYRPDTHSNPNGHWAGDYMVGDCESLPDNIAVCTGIAHARLIAAAPELLAALQASVDEVERLRAAMFKAYCVAANGGSQGEMLQAVEAERDAYESAYSGDTSRAAIAKATGATP